MNIIEKYCTTYCKQKYKVMQIILSLLISLSFTCQGKDGQWQLKKKKDDIQLYQKQLQGFKLKHHKAITIINTSADVVLSVLQDAEACPLWVHNCKVNKMVEMVDLTKRVYYTNIAAPLLLKDRDMYLQSDIGFSDQEKKTVIKLKSISTYDKPYKKRIRVDDVQMIWTVKAVTNNQTHVSYEVYIDPKIPIKSFVNRAILDSVFNTFQGLRKIVQLKKYH